MRGFEPYHRSRTKVFWTVGSDTRRLDFVTEMLGIEPTSLWAKGDKWETPRGVWTNPCSVWRIAFWDHERCSEKWEAYIRALVDLLEPKRPQIEELLASPELDISASVWATRDRDVGVLTLDAPLWSRLLRLVHRAETFVILLDDLEPEESGQA